MTPRCTHHDTFVIERNYAAPPARVFGAWAEKAAKASWFKGPVGSRSEQREFDFRVGGREYVVTTLPGGKAHTFDSVYRDIVEGARIVYCYDMFIGDTRISVSLATIEFASAGMGTRMTFTEQGIFLDGYDDAGSRARGSEQLLAQLEAALASDVCAAESR